MNDNTDFEDVVCNYVAHGFSPSFTAKKLGFDAERVECFAKRIGWPDLGLAGAANIFRRDGYSMDDAVVKARKWADDGRLPHIFSDERLRKLLND